jgi:signal transduction histidine kinase
LIERESSQLILNLNRIFAFLVKTYDLDEFIKNLLSCLTKDIGLKYSYFTIPESGIWITEGKFNKNELEKDLSEGSLIVLPIKIKEKTCASLALRVQTNESKWTEREKEALENFSNAISGIIEQIQLINDLKTSNEKLLNQDKTKSEVMSTVSHELRTPLSNVLGFSELLLMKDYPLEIRKQYVEEIHSSAIRLSGLIQDFLDLSRIEALGQLQLNSLEECEIDFLAENAWKHLSSQTKDHELEFLIKTNNLDELPLVLVDPNAITRVFMNLFSNAIKYSPLDPSLETEEKERRKKIICHIESKKNEVMVIVQDHGIGIAQNQIESIFERFFRIDNSSTRKIGGTGLGLWITKEIIEAHGGKIWCESIEKLGSNFAFVIPLKGKLDNETQIWLN